MKTIAKLILLLAFFQPVYGGTVVDCGDGINIYPKGETMYQNNFIVLSNWGYSRTASILKKIGEEYFVYLVSEDHEVKLKVEKLHEIKQQTYQLILKPEELLKPGRVYRIFVKNLEESHHDRYFKLRNQQTHELEDIEWIVLYGSDSQIPMIQAEPELLERTCTHLGCGSELYAIFEYKVSDKSNVFFEVEVTAVETKKITTFFTNTNEEHKVYVGRWMCGGPIDYRDGQNYEVRFKVFDMSGNTSNEWSKRINYEHPCERCE